MKTTLGLTPQRDGGPDAGREAAAQTASNTPPCPDGDAIDEDALYTEEDIPYGSAHRQVYDIAMPRAGALRLPTKGIVVVVHGGGWTSGTKHLFRRTLRALAMQGFAAAAMNYRLASDVRNAFPRQVQDVRCALHAISSHAVARGHAAPMVLIGASAGGHLAMLAASPAAAATFDDPACASAGPLELRGVVAYYPPLLLDRARERYGPRMNQAVDELLRAPSAAAWSQQVHAASAETYVAPNFVPTLFVHGDADSVVPLDDSVATSAALAALGATSQVQVVPGAGHGFPVLGAAPRWHAATCAAWQFLNTFAADAKAAP